MMADNPQPDVLPTEIIYHIIHHLDPLELVHLQTVSKHFHAIVNDPSVWRTLYRNTHLPRPPGPFPWQSTLFLQRTLVRSARLEQTWTSQPLRVTRSRSIVYNPGLGPNPLAGSSWWAGERWHITQTMEGIISRDLDTNSLQTLWSGRPTPPWASCSVINARGHLIYLVLRIGSGNEHDAVKLLEFQADDDTGLLSGPAVFDVPVRSSRGFGEVGVHLTSGNSPFLLVSVCPLYSTERSVVFDIRRLLFYKFPRVNSQLQEVLPQDTQFVIAMTHIIVITHFDDGEIQLVQAFTIAEQSSSVQNELRLSHETRLYLTSSSMDFSLIRQSVSDGSTTLRLLHSERSPGQRFHCTELCLPEAQTDAVLPIFHETYGISGIDSWEDYILSHDEGIARGICVVSHDIFRLVLVKFRIDATGDRCVATIWDDSSPEPVVSFFEGSCAHLFDGVRGRICYSRREGMDVVTSVVDLE